MGKSILELIEDLYRDFYKNAGIPPKYIVMHPTRLKGRRGKIRGLEIVSSPMCPLDSIYVTLEKPSEEEVS